MEMKKRIAMVMGLSLMIAAAAGVHAEDATEAMEYTQTGKLAAVFPTLGGEFFINIDSGLRTLCEENGWEYASVSYEGDVGTAITSLENMAMSGADVIMAGVQDNSCDGTLAQLQADGVKIVEMGVQTEVYDAGINTDQEQAGVAISEMAVDWVKKQLDGKGHIVVYVSNGSVDMINRSNGMVKTLEEQLPDSEILEVVDCGNDAVGIGASTTETMLQKYPDMDCIVAYGDLLAAEAVECVKSAGKASENFGVFSCDGTVQALEAISKGDIWRGTIVWDPLPDLIFGAAQGLVNGVVYDDIIPDGANKVTFDNIADYYTGE